MWPCTAGTMSAESHRRIAAVLEELEAATRRVEQAGAGDLDRLLVLMTQRSVAVKRLAALLEDCRRVPEPAVVERIRQQIDSGRRLHERLLLVRAAHRARLAKLLKDQHAAAAVSRVSRRLRRCLNVRG